MPKSRHTDSKDYYSYLDGRAVSEPASATIRRRRGQMGCAAQGVLDPAGLALVRVTFAEIATARPMGQQAYEGSIRAAIADLALPDLHLSRMRLTTLRNPVEADRRVPWGLLHRLPYPLARAMGAWVYRGSGLLHRMDLRLPPRGTREVVTVHDLPGLRFDDEGRVPAFLAAGARAASAVIVPSQFAKQEVVELLGLDQAAVHVIPYGLSATYTDPPVEPIREALSLIRPPFVVHAAGATTRKNLAALCEAWRVVSGRVPAVQLLLCGPEDARRTDLFAGLERVHLLGALAPEDVSWLMHRADAVVVPSTYEGFGLPALEGMAAGTPVVAARAGALPEVCGEAALLVTPDSEGIARGLLSALQDESLRAELKIRGPARAARFDWRRAALAHVSLYRSVTQGPRPAA